MSCCHHPLQLLILRSLNYASYDITSVLRFGKRAENGSSRLLSPRTAIGPQALRDSAAASGAFTPDSDVLMQELMAEKRRRNAEDLIIKMLMQYESYQGSGSYNA